MDRNGKVLRSRQTKNRPYALAIASSGDIILSSRSEDSRTVMKLSTGGSECPVLDFSPSWSYGVSVTTEGEILVCVLSGRVMRCNSDGGNARQLYDGKKKYSAIHTIELPDSNICISDDANKALVIIDKNGKILKQIFLHGVLLVTVWETFLPRITMVMCISSVRMERSGSWLESHTGYRDQCGWLWIVMTTCGLHKTMEISKWSNIWHKLVYSFIKDQPLLRV